MSSRQPGVTGSAMSRSQGTTDTGPHPPGHRQDYATLPGIHWNPWAKVVLISLSVVRSWELCFYQVAVYAAGVTRHKCQCPYLYTIQYLNFRKKLSFGVKLQLYFAISAHYISDYCALPHKKSWGWRAFAMDSLVRCWERTLVNMSAVSVPVCALWVGDANAGRRWLWGHVRGQDDRRALWRLVGN